MNTTSREIVEAALQLPASERAEVVSELLDSLSPDSENAIDDTWAAELNRRLAEFHDDASTAISWGQLRDEK